MTKQRVIEINLFDTKSINKAIKEVKDYQEWLLRKTDELRLRIAELIQTEAQQGFDSAVMSVEAKTGSVIKPSVSVTVKDDGVTTAVIAHGEDAVFVEFGAGVYYNGSSGSSPHPKGADFGFTIGSYGYGLGNRRAWAYYEIPNDKSTVRVTRGTPTQMPLYSAYEHVIQQIPSIVMEVYSK